MTYIHETAVIHPDVYIGEDCYIGPYCVIGYPAEHKSYWDKEKKYSVIIQDRCILTGSVTIDAGTEHDTIIANDCFFMKHSHIGHDCLIGERVVVSAGAILAGHVILENDVNIGINASIHQRQLISEGCMIGAGSVVTKKLLTVPFCKYAGVPAKYIGINNKK